MTPKTQPPQLPGLAVQIVIYGGETSINNFSQSAVGGGLPAASAPAIVVGRKAVPAGPDISVTRAEDQRSAIGLRARLRERGMVVTIAIIATAVAAVISMAVGICQWINWTP